MLDRLNDLQQLAREKEPENKKFFQVLKKKRPSDLDTNFHNLHEEAFSEIDCLECANCCKTTSPIFYVKDIDRLAKQLKMKSSDFIDKYLHIDKDGDYVLNSAPCAFLGPDNYCMVYESRPDACREYPHTNWRKMYQVLDLALKNTFICPAVYSMVEKLKKLY